MSTSTEIITILILLVLKGFFSGSEIAIVNCDKLKMRHLAKLGSKGAALVLKRFKTPDIILGTTLVGTNVATVTISTFGALIFLDLFGQVGDVIAVLFFTPFMLIFGEIVPKSIYQQKADVIAPIIIFPLTAATYLFYPAIFIFSRVARFVTFMVGGKSSHKSGYITREEFRMLLEMPDSTPSTPHAGDTRFDKERVRSIIRYAETTVGAAMIPLAEVIGIEQGAAMTEAMQMVVEEHIDRLPVYEGNITNVVGILTLRTWDLLEPDLARKDPKEYILPPLFISPKQHIHEALPLLQERPVDRMAVVVDEYGSAIGILLIEDIFSEVIGSTADVAEEEDEYSRRRDNMIEQVGTDVYLVEGRTPVSQLNETLNLNLPVDEAHTLAGLIISRLRIIPKVGAVWTDQEYQFTVQEADGRTIQKVHIQRI